MNSLKDRGWATLVGIVVTFVFLAFSFGQGYGQTEKFPNRPITVIVNYAAGGATDIAVRPLAKLAEKDLGVPLIIANKPGGGGTVGTGELARTKADGYTLGTLTIGATVVVPLMQPVAYDTFKDFDFICGFGRYIYGVFVKTDSPLKSMKDVVEMAKKNPGKVSYGTMSPSIAIGMKYVELKENVKMTYIPFQSGTESVTSLLGGHTQMCIVSSSEVLAFLQSKEVRGLAAISDERWTFMPGVPTMKELGYDIDITGWMGFGSPAGVPKERLGILYKAFKNAHQNPEVKSTFEKLGLSAPYITGEELKKIYQRRGVEWKPLLEALRADQAKK